MNSKFCTIDYLKEGSLKQKRAYQVLTENNIMEILNAYDPILTGTIPIAVDIDSSDLDIICCFQNAAYFEEILYKNFSKYNGFTIRNRKTDTAETVICSFYTEHFEIEIFGQIIPTMKQNAYRHLLVEQRILEQKGEAFRQKVIYLKKQGYKTEPAFCLLLGFTGDPYEALLKYS